MHCHVCQREQRKANATLVNGSFVQGGILSSHSRRASLSMDPYILGARGEKAKKGCVPVCKVVLLRFGSILFPFPFPPSPFRRRPFSPAGHLRAFSPLVSYVQLSSVRLSSLLFVRLVKMEWIDVNIAKRKRSPSNFVRQRWLTIRNAPSHALSLLSAEERVRNANFNVR